MKIYFTYLHVKHVLNNIQGVQKIFNQGLITTDRFNSTSTLRTYYIRPTLSSIFNVDPQYLLQQMAVARTSICLLSFICLIDLFSLFIFYICFLYFSFFINSFYLFIATWVWVRRSIRQKGNPFDRCILNVSQDFASWRGM